MILYHISHVVFIFLLFYISSLLWCTHGWALRGVYDEPEVPRVIEGCRSNPRVTEAF